MISPQAKTPFRSSLQQFIQVAAILVITIGCLTLVGWIFDIQILASALPGLVRMKTNTALSLILAGTSLLLTSQPAPLTQRLVGRICSLIITAIGLATLSEYLLGWNLGIDQLIFVADPQAVDSPYPGRMSLITAVCFSLAGSALWLSGAQPRQISKTSRLWVEVLAGTTTLLALQVLVAYLYQVEPIFELLIYTHMALNTAVGFVLLGIGILLTGPHSRLAHVIAAESAGGVIARRLLPAAIAIPLILGWLRIASERMGLLNDSFGVSILVILYIFIFSGLIIWNAQQLHQLDLQRQYAVEALYRTNDELEDKIEQRTRELRKANERLRQSEERLSLAIEGTGMAAWDLDLSSRQAQWSAQHFKLLGYEPIPSGEATLEMWQSRVHPEDLRQVVQSFERAQHEQTLYSSEFRIIRADNGKVAWLQAFGRFFYNEMGQAVRSVGIFFDNTDKRRAHAERDRFFTLSFDMLCISGVDGFFKQVNPAWEKNLGYTPAELIAQPFLSFVHPEDQARTVAEAELIATGFPTIGFENRYRCKDGSYKWLSWTSVLFPEEGLVYSVARDVTVRKQTEQQLKQQAATLQRQANLLELAYEAIIVRDAQGAITYWNRGAELTYGWTRQEARGQVTHAFLQTRTPEAITNLDATVLQQKSWQGELIHTRKDGRQIVVESRQVLIRDEQGIVTGFLEVNRDITERQQAEAEIRQLNATLEQRVQQRTTQLQEANQDLEAFSYTVAHDLRAPLRGIQGFAQALQEDYGDQLDEIAQRYIQQIFDGTDRMNALVQDLLAYSRLSREQVTLTRVSLDQVIAEAQTQLQPDLRDRQAEINLAESLPMVMGHRPILVQILVNLLSNAIKFVAPDVRPQIRVWAEAEEGWVHLWVEDNGIGIEPQYQEQIFGVFERLHGRAEYSGTGIGLAIVRKGAERLGGQAGVESSAGQGSRFWVKLQGAKM